MLAQISKGQVALGIVVVATVLFGWWLIAWFALAALVTWLAWEHGNNTGVGFAVETAVREMWNERVEQLREDVKPIESTPKHPWDDVRVMKLVEKNPWREGDLHFVYGVVTTGEAKGSILERSLTESDHVLIGAAPRGGKSYMASGLAFQALLPALAGEPRRVQLAIADMTGVTFPSGVWDGLPQLFGGKVAETREEILKLFGNLESEVNRRQELFKKYEGVQKLADYNRVATEPEPYIVVFIEELPATLMMLGNKKAREEFMSTLFRVPKYGVYIYGLAQRLTIDTLGPGRDAFGTRMWFRRVPQNVKPILDIPNDMQVSEYKKGRGVYVFGDEIGEFQSAIVEPNELLQIVKALKQERGLVRWTESQV